METVRGLVKANYSFDDIISSVHDLKDIYLIPNKFLRYSYAESLRNNSIQRFFENNIKKTIRY
ncbi:MAG: hypothetical protein ACE5KE_13725 [Methanosarcinales archaeon]